MKIEEGKFYKRADGSIHGPATRADQEEGTVVVNDYPWVLDQQTYTDDGHYYSDGTTSDYDLVEEVLGRAPTEDDPQPIIDHSMDVETDVAEAYRNVVRSAAPHEVVHAPHGLSEADARRIVLEVAEEKRAAAAAAEPVDIKAEIADTAKRIVNGARRGAYGTPERNFERIAFMWTAYAKAKGWPVEFAAGDVSPMMHLMKEARLVETPNHKDSFVDIVGYALTGAEVNGVQPEPANG